VVLIVRKKTVGEASRDWTTVRTKEKGRMLVTGTNTAKPWNDQSVLTKLSVAGTVCYVLWGCLHLFAAYAVYRVGSALDPGMVRGRVLQDSWNLLFFGLTGITVAVTLNIRNNAWGYWINLGVLALADTGLILFVLIPGYMPLWPGLAGPVLWVAGWVLTTLAYRRAPPRATSIASRA